MQVTSFTKDELLQVIESSEGILGPDDDKIRRRLWEIYGSALVYGTDVPLYPFLQTAGKEMQGKAFARYAELYRGYECPVAVFKTDEHAWTLRAVFEATRIPDHDREKLLFGLLSRAKVEYVPIPCDLVRQNYVHSSDFKPRSRRAIYAPLKVPFKRFPQPPKNGWPVKLPSPTDVVTA